MRLQRPPVHISKCHATQLLLCVRPLLVRDLCSGGCGGEQVHLRGPRDHSQYQAVWVTAEACDDDSFARGALLLIRGVLMYRSQLRLVSCTSGLLG
jgi:hypothetical protein